MVPHICKRVASLFITYNFRKIEDTAYPTKGNSQFEASRRDPIRREGTTASKTALLRPCLASWAVTLRLVGGAV